MHNRGYHDFPSKTSCLQVPKSFIAEHFGVSQKLRVSKFFVHSRGDTRVLSIFSCLAVSKNLVSGTLVFQKCSGIEKFFEKESRFCEFFFVAVLKSSYLETYCFSVKFWLGKCFLDERGDITFFRRKFLSPSAENFRGDPFNVSENFEYPNFLCIIIEGGGIMIFCRIFFLFQYQKISLGNTSVNHKTSGGENFRSYEGGTRGLSILFVSQYQKTSYRDPCV